MGEHKLASYFWHMVRGFYPNWALLFNSNIIVNKITKKYNLLLLYYSFIDETLTLNNEFNDTADIETTLKDYVSGLNEIYESSIFISPPNERIYFRIGKFVELKNFVPQCEDAGIVLSEFSQVIWENMINLAIIFVFIVPTKII